eukprot:GHVS01083166.1.p1 GENE.GHVS01083166.1~~GHVS01083166.1.p1  ORF type:complete len:119 (-),score=8.16 GHVS01083166.1:308-664(-)
MKTRFFEPEDVQMKRFNGVTTARRSNNKFPAISEHLGDRKVLFNSTTCNTRSSYTSTKHIPNRTHLFTQLSSPRLLTILGPQYPPAPPQQHTRTLATPQEKSPASSSSSSLLSWRSSS